MKVGIIGMGHIGQKHLKAIALAEGVEICAVCDTGTLPQSLPSGIQTGLGVEDILNHTAIDLVVICLPNYLHSQMTCAALASGKHVICEKPLALSTRDCREMLMAARQNAKHLFCVLQNRYAPASQYLKHLVSEGKIGDVYMVNIRCYWNRHAAYYKSSTWKGDQGKDGGTLFTQFSHFLDSLLWLFGDIVVTSAEFRNFNHRGIIDFEDSGVFTFALKNGGIGSFTYTTAVYERSFESQMTIIASKGTVQVTGQYMDKISFHAHSDTFEEVELPRNDNIQNLSRVYDNAEKVISGKKQSDESAKAGMKVVSLIESIYALKI